MNKDTKARNGTGLRGMRSWIKRVSPIHIALLLLLLGLFEILAHCEPARSVDRSSPTYHAGGGGNREAHPRWVGQESKRRPSRPTVGFRHCERNSGDPRHPF